MKSSEQINESHNPVASCVHWKHLHLQTIIYLSVSPCVSIYTNICICIWSIGCIYIYIHMSIPMWTRMHRHIFENWRQSSAQREPTLKARTMRTEECTETATQKLQAITTLILSQHSFFTYDFNIFLFGLLFICCLNNKNTWKYELHAESTTLWACSCRPSAANVTSTNASLCKSDENTDIKFGWWLFQRKQNCCTDIFFFTYLCITEKKNRRKEKKYNKNAPKTRKSKANRIENERCEWQQKRQERERKIIKTS